MFQTDTVEPSTLDFDAFNLACKEQLARVIRENGPALFTVDASDLNAIYLDNLPGNQRQHHTCNCCRRFIERFGALVSIEPTGVIRSAFWNEEHAPEGYGNAAAALRRAVESSKVTGVFYCDDAIWGVPEAGGFDHFHAANPLGASSGVATAFQRMAAKREDFRTLTHALREFPLPVVREAINLLDADALTRSEKVMGPARFLYEVHASNDNPVRSTTRKWLAVAKAPAGFCTPRSGMIGTLLDDLIARKPIEQIKRSFAEKMRGDRYQRPQAAPAAGNIAQAEKLVEQMGIEPALQRRYARIEEVKHIWTPPPLPASVTQGGVFGHIKPKGEAEPVVGTSIPRQIMTWARFRSEVLPRAATIGFHTASSRSYVGLLTAVNSDAPPIIQWDQQEQRNPFSHYLYVGGSYASDWGLTEGVVEVTGVAFKPHMWHDEQAYPHQAKGVIFFLKGAIDQRGAHLCLFPETLRSELHPVRATIERHSQSRKAEGREEATANGVLFAEQRGGSLMVRVRTETGVTDIALDRWY